VIGGFGVSAVGALGDLAHRHADVGPAAVHVDLARIGQGGDGGGVDMGVGGDEFLVGVHGGSSFLALGASLPVLASEWHSVVTGKTETIDIDKSRIARGAGGTTGWSRILLGQDVKDPGGVYNAIHAQNLYDCGGRRFTTLRRAYFNGDTLVREESVSRQRANKVQAGQHRRAPAERSLRRPGRRRGTRTGR
jgi:hypothetical protein